MTVLVSIIFVELHTDWR